jgi:hypothetical protein
LTLKKYLNAIKSSKQILEGFKNKIFKQEHIEAEAELRMDICKKCSFLDTVGTHCLMPGTQPCCGDCGCTLGLKTRSLSSDCPQGKWHALLTEEEEDILTQQLAEDGKEENPE